jgi:SRSO17 transposase
MRRALAPFSKLESSNHTQSSADFITNTSGFSFRYTQRISRRSNSFDLPYIVGVQSTLTVWPPGQRPLPSKPWNGHGRKPSRLNRDLEHQPVTVKELALSLKKKAWRMLTWREGSNTPLSFAAVRLRPASRDYNRTKPHPVEWLIVEWPNGEAEPRKYWLSTLPKDTPL